MGVRHIFDAPIVEISDGVACDKAGSGRKARRRTMSVKSLTKYGERIQRALARYARGEQNIIVDD